MAALISVMTVSIVICMKNMLMTVKQNVAQKSTAEISVISYESQPCFVNGNVECTNEYRVGSGSIQGAVIR